MKQLLTIHMQDIDSAAVRIDPTDFSHRRAARAVVLDEKGRVPLLWVSKDGYHKLPGGGIEEGEDIHRALKRELMEEIGCKADVTDELGEIVEFRDDKKMKQTSYCYLSRLSGSKGEPSFTDEELADGFEIVWTENLAEAVRCLEHDHPIKADGKFKQLRDLTFLKAAAEILS